jgi:hypothetical protein
MRVRHANMKAHSKFLSTKTEPKLVSVLDLSLVLRWLTIMQYYKPWELQPEEDEQIQRQIEEVEDQIDREVEEFDRKKAAFEADNNDSPPGNGIQRESVGSASREASSKPIPLNQVQSDTNPTPAPDESLSNIITEHNSILTKDDAILDENHGETVLEAEEDTVIY